MVEESLQVQGLLDVLPMSCLELSSSHPCLHVSRDQQEARLAEKLRQQAGPAAITEVEQLLIQRAYSLKPNGSGHWTVIISDEEQTPRQLPHDPLCPSTLWSFVCQYIDVIQRDLQVLGYRITIQKLYRGATQPAAGTVHLQASLSGPVGTVLGTIMEDLSPDTSAIRVIKC